MLNLIRRLGARPETELTDHFLSLPLPLSLPAELGPQPSS